MQEASKRRQIVRLIAWAIWLASLVGLIVRLTVQDIFPIVSAIYYATPTAVLFVSTAISAILWWRLKCRRRGHVSLILATACLVWWYQTSFVRHSPTHSDADIRVVFWNVANGKLGWTGVTNTLKSLDADIIGLVEVGTDANTTRRLRESFPNYRITDAEGGLVIMSRDGLLGEQVGALDSRCHYKRAKVTVRGSTFHVFVVDVKSNPLMFRQEPLDYVANITSKLSNEPVLVMGDFNTPADSVHFRPLRAEFINAFESHGNGYSPTWPLPLPILQLDHIWTNRAIVVSSCQAAWAWKSDHRALVAKLRPRSAQ